jgi:hypothetical protein
VVIRLFPAIVRESMPPGIYKLFANGKNGKKRPGTGLQGEE